MYFPRKINYFRVNSKILELFYKSFLESLISFALTCWGGNVRMNNKEKINQIIKKANKIISRTSHSPSNLCDFDSLYHVNCQRKILSILKDQSHPLSGEILFSSRSGRPLAIKCNKNRYTHFFLPHALKGLDRRALKTAQSLLRSLEITLWSMHGWRQCRSSVGTHWPQCMSRLHSNDRRSF